MARFSVYDRVRIPQHHPQADSLLWGQIGTVTRVGPPMRWINEGESDPFVEQQYEVGFDGVQEDRIVYENWLEPAPSDEQ